MPPSNAPTALLPDGVAIRPLRADDDIELRVAREHRGHRLGLAIKAANLLAAQRAFPDRTAVHTSNHEDNANMVAINERMGFRPVELHVQFLRQIG